MADEIVYTKPEEVKHFDVDFTEYLTPLDTALNLISISIIKSNGIAVLGLITNLTNLNNIISGTVGQFTEGEDYLLLIKVTGNISQTIKQWVIEYRARRDLS